MKLSDISGIRLANQHISGNKLNTVKELVTDMGAIQAQDFAMAKWAIGLRLKNATEQLVDEALDKGDILRTHLLRPTWHIVSAEDIRWMISLSGPRIKASMKSRNRQLELTRSVFEKCNNIIKKALNGSRHLTREELITQLSQAKIKTDMNRASHILMEAELDGIICSGKSKQNKLTYALLDERVTDSKSLTREESLAKLAHTYFGSRGPSTVKDFAWWSGLSVTDAKIAIGFASRELEHTDINEQTYWFSNPIPRLKTKNTLYLLPTYDEYLISYADRSAILLSETHKAIISSYGIFRALVIVNNLITGIWTRSTRNNKVILEMKFFEQPDTGIRNLINKEAERFGRFMGKEIEIL